MTALYHAFNVCEVSQDGRTAKLVFLYTTCRITRIYNKFSDVPSTVTFHILLKQITDRKRENQRDTIQRERQTDMRSEWVGVLSHSFSLI